LLFEAAPVFGDYRWAALSGFIIAFLGQTLRAATIGLHYIKRGGRGRRIYADRLVDGGLVAHCRNPLYLGNLAVITGIALASNSSFFIAISLPAFAFAYLCIILAEERYLRKRFGSEYDEYCLRVPRFIPRLSGIRQTIAGTRFDWRRLITAEYGSTYYWVTGMCVIILRNAWLEGVRPSQSGLVTGLWVGVTAATAAYVAARAYKKGWLSVR
jgi:steroid 5-alpha reductase family enzyme